MLTIFFFSENTNDQQSSRVLRSNIAKITSFKEQPFKIKFYFLCDANVSQKDFQFIRSIQESNCNIDFQIYISNNSLQDIISDIFIKDQSSRYL